MQGDPGTRMSQRAIIAHFSVGVDLGEPASDPAVETERETESLSGP